MYINCTFSSKVVGTEVTVKQHRGSTFWCRHGKDENPKVSFSDLRNLEGITQENFGKTRNCSHFPDSGYYENAYFVFAGLLSDSRGVAQCKEQV